ncbi:hypothetical protein V2A60_002818 [Cordyceps javanica]|uniref:Glyoxalase family protein n=1 Tax=Cordyceps javanica TaxID=43265 RepID=A0A545VWC9_9HYPO|nr:glyoxalase family protein [Cordyceps javanica]TQW05996.1 glyoxalase family protein [Cordyceps javanica]
MPHIAHVSVVVRDYDEALAFYVGKLGFTVVEDRPVPEQNKRWVTIAPPGAAVGSGGGGSSSSAVTTILLARASSPDQLAAVGRQTGDDRVFLFLATDDFRRDYDRFTAAGVEWARPVAVHDYGTVAVFKDLYGNLWDLIEYARR